MRARDLEQTLPQLVEDDAAFGGRGLAAKTTIAGQIGFEIDFLIAVVFQDALQSACEILRPLVPIQLGHRPNGFGQHRMQVGRQFKQVAATRDEPLVILRVGEIQAAGQAGQNQPETENVGQRIMVLEAMLPADIAAKPRRSLKFAIVCAPPAFD